MEQNINKLGAFVATLALIASVLVMPNVSAGDEDLSVTLVGDKGLTSYGAKYGHASFTGSVSSTSDDADENLTITASFAEEGWTSIKLTLDYGMVPIVQLKMMMILVQAVMILVHFQEL